MLTGDEVAIQSLLSEAWFVTQIRLVLEAVVPILVAKMIPGGVVLLGVVKLSVPDCMVVELAS